MRVTLLYPPDFNPPAMPFGALPLLSACLKRAGHETDIIDLNAAAFDVMCLPENLERYCEITDRMAAALAALPTRTPAQDEELSTWRRLQTFPRHVLLDVRRALRTLRNPGTFYDPESFTHAHRTVQTTHAFLHAMTPRLDPRNTHFTAQLYAYLTDPAPDPYVDVYINRTIPRCVRFAPGLVAFSVPFSPQVAPAMRFAQMLRAEMPGVKFVIGGTGIADAAQVILTDPRFYDVIDYAITGDGENALPELVEALEGRRALDDVSALWRRERGVVRPPTVTRLADMDASPTPDYRDIDFSPYLLPEPSAIYTTSRGCYYGKCTFCPESFRLSFRMRAPERVYDDIRNLVNEQGVRHIHFFDPLTPPRTLAHVAREVARENLPVFWHAEVKFETIYTSENYVGRLAAGGCKLLQFGLESGVQSVLDRMQKGNRLDQMDLMLDNLERHHICVATTWFIGFPTENEEDARETWRYLDRNADRIHLQLYTGTFGLGHDVPVFQHPDDYNIDLVFDAVGNPDYRRRDGGDWDQKPLHEAFQVRTDIQLLISGFALLYSAHHPERLAAIRGMDAIGAPSFIGAPVESRFAMVPPENGVVEAGTAADGTSRFRVFVAASGDTFEIDEADVALLKAIGHDGAELAAVLARPEAPADALQRLGRFVNRGYVRTPSPGAVACPAGRPG